MNNKASKIWKFTNVQHPARIALQLSLIEYCVLDVIYQSQTNPLYSAGGWAKIGARKLADFFGISVGGVSKIYARMEERGYLEFSADRNLKKTTPAFYENVYMEEAGGGVHEVNTRSQSEHQVFTKCTPPVHKVNTRRSQSEHPGRSQSEHIKEYRNKERKEREINARASVSEKNRVNSRPEETSPPVAAAPPSWMEVADAMAEYYLETEQGQSEWFYMCKAAGIDTGAVDVNAITSIWAGKQDEFTLRHWQRHTSKLHNWIKNQANDRTAKKSGRGRNDLGASEETIIAATESAIAEYEKYL